MIARFLAFVFLLTGSLLGQQPETMWCAIVRDDGLLVPFAYFNGSQWFFWPVSDPPRTMKIGTPVLIERYAAPEPGLAFVTDYCAQTTITNVYPYPKAGVAFQGKVSYQRLVRADTSQEPTRQLHAVLYKTFYQRETSVFADSNLTFRLFGMLPPSLQQREKATMRIQALYQSEASENGRTYYFELLRSFPYDNCFSVTMFSGWATGTPQQLVYAQEELSFGDCDGKGLANNLEPFGLIKLLGKKYAVVDISPYEGEHATLLEWRGNQLIDVLPPEY